MKNRLKAARVNANMTQEAVAKALKITIRQYQNIEAVTPKAVIQFYKLSRLLNVKIDDLLEQVDDTQ